MNIEKFLADKRYENKTERVYTLPFRSFYVPYSKNKEFEYIDGIINKNKSDLYISLNGKWKFKAYKRKEDIKSLDIDIDNFIDVPSSIQMQGYDQNQYLNHRYPFPFNPPYIDIDNPLFHYQKIINIDSLLDEYYLCFEGVDSCFYLFINNEFVGYSQISHSLSEFEINKFLKIGDNKIDVINLKWCASSYLEDQDKFRMSGIFRDVYLLKRNKNHIRDFKIETSYQKDKGTIIIENLSNSSFKARCLNKEINIKPKEKGFIYLDKINLWDSDNPYLYNVVIFNEYEKILQRVGFRKISIDNGIFKINDKHIKLKGVNRHEFHPLRGAAITFEDTLKDLKMIKQYGCNAIRTSHYPNIPEFYDLCDYFGIYVVDEADLESHGAASYKGGYDLALWEDFANNGIYDNAVLDREMSLYERDKNHPSVIIWSLGNESSWGKMFFKGADYIKNKDDRPIHYEGIYNLVKNKEEYYTNRIDIASRMYPQISFLTDEFLKDEKEKRPLMLCEYSHSMGNSNGDLSDYWKAIYSNDRFMGAFIWEWCDHALYIDHKLLYGGDSNETDHDGNFCVDGLTSAFREIKTNLLEMEAIYKGKLIPSKEINKCKKLVKLNKYPPIDVVFDDYNASITSIKINKDNVLTSPLKLIFTRAFIDNDMFHVEEIKKLENAPLNIKKVIKHEDGREYIISKGDYLDLDVRYILYQSALDIKIKYIINNKRKYINRIGIEFAIKKDNLAFSFFGYGKDESYIDKRLHTDVGEHSSSSEDNYWHYLKPQESGSHYYTSYVRNEIFDIDALKPFSFNIIPYSKERLMNTKHDYELLKDGNTYISIDLSMAGVGSNSCGPELLEKYQLPLEDENVFRISFKE